MKNNDDILKYIDELDKKINYDMMYNKKVVALLENLYSSKTDMDEHNKLMKDKDVINYIQMSEFKLHFEDLMKERNNKRKK